MGINVAEVMGTEPKERETVVKKDRRADIDGAYARLNCLLGLFEVLEHEVNSTNVENTSDAWHIAYARITKAFKDCIKEEKEIIIKA